MSIWEAMAGRGREVHFGPGDVLVHHGDVSHHCYAIIDGEVLVTATSSQGGLVVLGRRGPGAVVGELSALDRKPRAATVTARTAVVANVLQPDEFEELLRHEPEVAIAELRRLSAQLRSLTERYALRGDELKTRVASLLLTHADEGGGEVFRSTREELAGWVGATREATIRSLRELESDGAVVLGRGVVEVADRDRLVAQVV